MAEAKTQIKRKIVIIDEEKCNGCGSCVPACAEGALEIVDGKARLLKELYCDGLGACLGECPQGAIAIEERTADAFDEQAVQHHMHQLKEKEEHQASPQACPGSATRSWAGASAESAAPAGEDAASALRQWPVQITLVPPSAPYLKNANLLISADCVPFSFAGFHRRLLAGRRILIGCPKLDDLGGYVQKLQAVFQTATPASITVAIMEVPCCGGLVHAVREALKGAGSNLELNVVVVGVDGMIQT